MNHLPILSITLFIPILGAILIMCLSANRQKAIKYIAAAATFVSLILSLLVFLNYDRAVGGMQFIEHIPWIADLGVSYALGVDGISIPLLLLTNLIGFSAVYASWNIKERVKEFFVLLLILITGVMGTFVTTDLFIFFLFYEVVVIPIYLLVIMFGSSKRVTKEYAGMKLTIYLLIGSAFLLVGLIALFVKSKALLGFPSMDIMTLAKINYPLAFQIFAYALMAVGFGTLLSMFPFHAWSPDGYAGAPTAVSMIHAGVLKKIGGYGLIRIGLFILPAGAKYIAPLIAVLAIFNVVYAAFICLSQKDLKYIVGYSSVSHMGYVLIGIAALNVISLNGAVMMMFAHGVMAALFFAMIGNLYEKSHTRNVSDFGGLAHQMPRLATGFMLAGLASLGLPGTVNFIGEFTIFVGAFSVYRVISIIAITGIILTAVYILRTLGDVLFGPRREEWDHLEDLQGPEMVPLIVLGTAILIGGILPFTVMDLINSGVGQIIAHIGTIQIGGIF
ncbi:NADH-quinone oxidoreductase, chain M/4 [Syntrophomonas zehnderi OL-4]|uniref:NADH-quinone oxidoreductase, chain M/4 n=1 Tax=Syntrophomonas zehnderi OL-4 TaxID=690567 RepID=A0A0E4G9Y3_9FIRM|nr:NADH-quinone oxidoreductase subunit M [Syntrophomonas zehnderi]CFX29086.1 NADH-quinone oxidoreductase, chain M/4 [Syntrophomonas zehnderi OL-4]